MSNNQLVDILQNMLLTPASDFYVSKLLHSPEQDWRSQGASATVS